MARGASDDDDDDDDDDDGDKATMRERETMSEEAGSLGRRDRPDDRSGDDIAEPNRAASDTRSRRRTVVDLDPLQLSDLLPPLRPPSLSLFLPPPLRSLRYELFIGAFEDTTVVILCVSALVSLAVGVYDDPATGWIEGCAILAAVLIVAVVTATNDYNKAKQFRALNALKDNIRVRAIRAGAVRALEMADVLVGDVIALEAGDKVPADAVMIKGNDVQCDESSLTGESEDCPKDADADPFLLSGCEVKAGSCTALVIAVGDASRWGRIKARLAAPTAGGDSTPLQEKLDDLAQVCHRRIWSLNNDEANPHIIRRSSTTSRRRGAPWGAARCCFFLVSSRAGPGSAAPRARRAARCNILHIYMYVALPPPTIPV